MTSKIEQGIAVIKDIVRTLPLSPGVYRMLSAADEVLYVGKAKALQKRVTSYTRPDKLPTRTQRMIAETARMEIVTTHTEVEALLLESNLIKQLKPRFNVNLRDDKMFPYIALSKGDLAPRLYKYRGALDKKKADYYGPYASAGAVITAMEDLTRAFRLRTCSDNVFKNRTRPCLQYHIKRCSAPCTGVVTHDTYVQQVNEAREFLSGRSRTLQDKYAREMDRASATRQYEEAALYRDRIQALNAVQTEQDINILSLGDVDVIGIARAGDEGGQVAIQVFFFRGGRNFGARSYFPQHDATATLDEVVPAFLMQFYLSHPIPPAILISETVAELNLIGEGLTEHARHKVHVGVPTRGDKKRLVEHAARNAGEALARRLAERGAQAQSLRLLCERFDLPNPPARIEVYDNSHISGSHPVGAMIVAGPEGFMKNAYRKFNMKDAAGNDDFGMMREMLSRRFGKVKPDAENLPDLVIIDGGAGQLNAVKEVLEGLGFTTLPIVAIAKGPDRNAGREDFYVPGQQPFKLPPDDPLLYFIQRLRDEAHRFAIGSHRARRSAAISQNPLADIPGIGATRKKALLRHFGSAREVANAGVGDLAKVPGISYDLAQKIYGFFHET